MEVENYPYGQELHLGDKPYATSMRGRVVATGFSWNVTIEGFFPPKK